MLLLGDSLLHHVRKPITTPRESVQTHIESIGGCTIDRLTELVRQRQFDCLFHNQKHLILIIGTNNLAREKSQSSIVKLEILLHLIRRQYPCLKTVAISTVPERTKTSIFHRTYGDDGGKSIRKRIMKYNHKLRRLQRRQRSSQTFSIIPLELNKNKHLSNDGLHPNARGIEQISTILQTYADTIQIVEQ